MRRRATASAPAPAASEIAAVASGAPRSGQAAEPPAEADGDFERGGDEAEHEHHMPAVQFGQRFVEQAMRAVAGEDGGKRTDQEGRIRRPAIEADAGHHLVEQAKDGRVPAERVEQGDARGDGEEADLGRPQPAAQRRQEQQDHRNGADVELAHVLGEEDAGALPGKARRAPVVLHAARSAEHFRREECEQQGRVQRAPPSADVVDGGPVGVRGQQRGQYHGHGDRARRRRLRPPTAAGGSRAPRPPAGRPRAGARARTR